MFIAPKRYECRCINSESGDVLLQQEFEAINQREAETRSYLNCIKDTSVKKESVEVSAKRVIF